MRHYEPDDSLPDRDPTPPAEPHGDRRLAWLALAFAIMSLIVNVFAPYWKNSP